MTLGDVCEHGSLARSCLICELEATIVAAFGHIAALKAEVEQLTRERDEARAERDYYESLADKLNQQIGGMT